MKGPKNRYRILPWSDNVSTLYYATQEDRDEAAERLARELQQTMFCELWDESHPQDYLNEGWACDRIVQPPADGSPFAQLNGDGR